MRPIPVKLPRPADERTVFEDAVVEAEDRHDLGNIAGAEDFVSRPEILDRQRLLVHRNAVSAQQADHPLAGDAVQERSPG